MQARRPAAGLAVADPGCPQRRLKGVTYDGLLQRRPVAAGEEGGCRSLAEGALCPGGGVTAKHTGKVSAHRHEPALVEFRIVCAVERRFHSAGANPVQQLMLRLVAARAVHGGNEMG